MHVPTLIQEAASAPPPSKKNVQHPSRGLQADQKSPLLSLRPMPAFWGSQAKSCRKTPADNHSTIPSNGVGVYDRSPWITDVPMAVATAVGKGKAVEWLCEQHTSFPPRVPVVPVARVGAEPRRKPNKGCESSQQLASLPRGQFDLSLYMAQGAKS